MKKPIVLKSLFLNLALIFLLMGLYSCGGGENSNNDNDTDSEEVIIMEVDDDESADGDSHSDADDDGNSDADTDGDEREDMNVSSKSEDAELEMILKNPGFEDSYYFADVDEPPMFEECEGKVTIEEQEHCFQKFLMKNISENVKYPESAKELNVEGKVYVAFVVDKTGNISHSKVVRGSGYNYERGDEPINEYIDAYNDLDAAAIEAINQTQKIKPAMVENAPVNVQYTIPISFELQ